jgi:5-formyltetrahydrofolate cyclo-ligase
MSKANPLIQKNEWRELLLLRRKAIRQERRREASLLLAQAELPPGNVLSFSSVGSEIDLKPLNRRLLREGRLYLPRVLQTGLSVHRVEDLDSQLIPSHLKVLEPDPKQCEEVALSAIDLILVPGIAFDGKGNRIGYGKGYYDQLLARHKAYTIGIGFREQKVDFLPNDPWDLKLDALLLF